MIKLLEKHEVEVRDIAINLYKYDYLDKVEIKKIIDGKKLDKELVREFDIKTDTFAGKF